MSVDLLLSTQNPDGGWPYVRGRSWTEPTVYAVLALAEAGERGAAERGLAWLRKLQRGDGGWPPQAGVEESTWVTALVAHVPREDLGASAHGRAIRWIAGLTGKESTRVYRFREWLLGHQPAPDQSSPGWPWMPETAAWVTPTSLAILALQKECRRAAGAEWEARIEAGRQFLLNRTCDQGGWNHGSVRALGYPSEAYPETTGLALAALRGVDSPKVGTGLNLAERFLSESNSADELNWLRLGLLAHGRLPAGYTVPARVCRRRLQEHAIDWLVTAAVEGRGSFLGIPG